MNLVTLTFISYINNDFLTFLILLVSFLLTLWVFNLSRVVVRPVLRGEFKFSSFSVPGCTCNSCRR